jgi:tRNA pseudouridine55 synthase
MHGLLIIDKAEGISSAGALAPIKRILGRKHRVGHAGTLDPFATGALVVLVGDVTRLADTVLALTKTYTATVQFGAETDTLDPTGEVVAEADPGAAPPADLEAAVQEFSGEIVQVPPAHSALKVGGRPAYRLARKGRPPELSPRTVTVHKIGIDAVRWPALDLTITCGSGTYIRAIARDLGRRLDIPAHLRSLRRTTIGPFAADDGVLVGKDVPLSPTRVRRQVLPPIVITRAAGLPEARLGREDAELCLHGHTPPAGSTLPEGTLCAMTFGPEDVLIGLGEVNADGSIRPVKVFPHARPIVNPGGAWG